MRVRKEKFHTLYSKSLVSNLSLANFDKWIQHIFLVLAFNNYNTQP